MALEIERKFLLINEDWKHVVSKEYKIEQAYLSSSKESTVRIRISNEKAYLTIKGLNQGAIRQEFEYEVPFEEAKEMIKLCEGRSISKTRYHVKVDKHLWEIDVFDNENEGLLVAEIELQHEDEEFSRPSWLGQEVTYDIRYYNLSLMKNPFKTW